MPVKQYKPTSPARRFASVVDYRELTKKRPEPSLIEPLSKTGGRNNQGRITCRHIGGGNKNQYRRIDFKRNKVDITARVESIEYDPNRTCFIALLCYQDGERRYILAPKELQVGEIVLAGEKVEPKTGNCMPLKNIPLGMLVHNLELKLKKGGQLIRSAGSFGQIMAKEGKYVHVLLPSGEIRKVDQNCKATIGQLSNIDWNKIWWGKAGRSRWRGIRPTVRGSAMNPVAHPMGGGEGRRGGGRHPCSPTGKLAKGGKTRKRNKHSNIFIVRKRKGR
ncbi:MAG: 50S ribosomal protein L2 [Planctomycetes bacterium]|nr:50S ribosomal protein L2 [Planctomycetota bacterium]